MTSAAITEHPSDPIFKTTLEIWTSYDPAEVEIDYLAWDAIYGDAICSRKETICNPADVPEGVLSFLQPEELDHAS